MVGSLGLSIPEVASRKTISNSLLAPVNLTPPTFSGTLEPGQTLTVTSFGTWANLDPGFSDPEDYQWAIDGVTVPAAKNTTFVVPDNGENADVTLVTDAFNFNFPTGPNDPTSSAVSKIVDPHWASVDLHLSFDGTNGSTTHEDASTNSAVPTTFNGNAALSNLQTKFAVDTTSLLLDGTGDFCEIPDYATLDWGGAGRSWTFEAWVRPTAIGVVSCIWGHRNAVGTAGGGLLNFHTTNTLRARTTNGGSSPMLLNAGTPTVSSGTWYHVAIVRNGTSWSLYQNGLRTDTDTQTGEPATENATHKIGRDEIDTSSDFTGNIAHVRYTGLARYSGATLPVPVRPFYIAP